MNATSGEDRTFGIRGAGVSGIVVERLPLLVQRSECRLVLCERPVAATDAAPRLLSVDFDEDCQRTFSQRRPDLVGSDRAATQRDYRRYRRAQCLERVLRLAEPESCLTAGLEDPRDGLDLLDLAVDVDERPPEARRESLAERRLPGAHEADQGDVTV